MGTQGKKGTGEVRHKGKNGKGWQGCKVSAQINNGVCKTIARARPEWAGHTRHNEHHTRSLVLHKVAMSQGKVWPRHVHQWNNVPRAKAMPVPGGVRFGHTHAKVNNNWVRDNNKAPCRSGATGLGMGGGRTIRGGHNGGGGSSSINPTNRIPTGKVGTAGAGVGISQQTTIPQ